MFPRSFAGSCVRYESRLRRCGRETGNLTSPDHVFLSRHSLASQIGAAGGKASGRIPRLVQLSTISIPTAKRGGLWILGPRALEKDRNASDFRRMIGERFPWYCSWLPVEVQVNHGSGSRNLSSFPEIVEFYGSRYLGPFRAASLHHKPNIHHQPNRRRRSHSGKTSPRSNFLVGDSGMRDSRWSPKRNSPSPSSRLPPKTQRRRRRQLPYLKSSHLRSKSLESRCGISTSPVRTIKGLHKGIRALMTSMYISCPSRETWLKSL